MKAHSWRQGPTLCQYNMAHGFLNYCMETENSAPQIKKKKQLQKSGDSKTHKYTFQNNDENNNNNNNKTVCITN